jgi:hypothetical protein
MLPAIVAAKPPEIFQPAVTDWAIPILFSLIAAFGKKLARVSTGWLLEDFYLGPDLCLAAISVGLLKIFDLLRHLPVPEAQLANFEYEVGMATLLIVVSFLLFIFVVCEHRECDIPANERAARPAPRFARTRLFVICNFIGLAALSGFVVLIKPWDML